MSTISKLHLPAEFTYQFFIQNRYDISKNKNYEALCNNGFIKLYSPNGRLYWYVQNEFNHLTPDWKFHISFKHQQLSQAWNLIAALFIGMKCRSGMKTYYLKECIEPPRGREITVYIMKYQDLYLNSSFANDFEFSRADEHSEEFWYEFVKNVQEILESHGIESNGVAEGDLKIGKYVSLRNEAYVLGKSQEHVYPPNDMGWNAANQQVPLNLVKLNECLAPEEESKSTHYKYNKNRLISIVIPIAVAAMAYYTSTKR